MSEATSLRACCLQPSSTGASWQESQGSTERASAGGGGGQTQALPCPACLASDRSPAQTDETQHIQPHLPPFFPQPHLHSSSSLPAPVGDPYPYALVGTPPADPRAPVGTPTLCTCGHPHPCVPVGTPSADPAAPVGTPPLCTCGYPTCRSSSTCGHPNPVHLWAPQLQIQQHLQAPQPCAPVGTPPVDPGALVGTPTLVYLWVPHLQTLEHLWAPPPLCTCGHPTCRPDSMCGHPPCLPTTCLLKVCTGALCPIQLSSSLHQPPGHAIFLPNLDSICLLQNVSEGRGMVLDSCPLHVQGDNWEESGHGRP
ncbi:hypothetical protein P7K49_012159 [Saguinus oedipus]|uniref:Uncharacterized protein n=1 Tax=Saguinus oedipus TaxID=9490 RepID=A0ABQ9VSQ6_SAGOE|nr:hypothetical protein P7K49_012159 [Saguinus oedipus]